VTAWVPVGTLGSLIPKWGYTRIRGALYNLGHDVARNTVKRILLERGYEPAPERGRVASRSHRQHQQPAKW